MFFVDVERFFKTLNPKKINTATGKSMSSLYRYAADPNEEDRDKRGVPMSVDFLMQIVNSRKLDRKKTVLLLKYLVEACGYELNEDVPQLQNISIEKQAKHLEVLKSMFSVKNWQALEDNKITPEAAAGLITLAENEREHLTKYIGSLRKIINGASK